MTTQGTPSGRIIRRVVLVGVALMLAGMAGLWFMFSSPPIWWPAAGVLPPDAAERAAALERGASRVLSESRDESTSWTISISEADANAWLTHRLQRWAENRGIEMPVDAAAQGGIQSRLRVHFDGGRLRLGAEIDGRILSLSAIPAVDGAALSLREPRFSIGRVEFSTSRTAGLAGMLATRLGSGLSEDRCDQFRGLLDGSRALADPARLRMDDGREVSLLQIRFEGDRLLITCRTSMPGSSESDHHPPQTN